ncbi:MAG TPA: hydrogenase maturation protease [Terriglobales bacterium]
MTTDRPSIVVIGVGNDYRSDDGVGIVIARRLRAQLPAEINIIEASGEGVSLLDAWQGATSVILLDAACFGRRAGTVYRFDASTEPIPSAFLNYSTHGFSLAEAVELSRVLHELPPHLIVYGIEGGTFEAGVELSPAVEGAVASVIAQVIRDVYSASLSESIP